jgi:beta-glucosidase
MSRIDDLIAKMTLAEKLGQLTMTASSFTVTGPVIAGDSTESIRNGTIGNLLNMVGAEPVHQMQRLAVEESRLGIPLLIGLDIIHGHRSLFPIPIAEAGLFDPQAWIATARETAKEAAADGLAMTFAPMLDVSRDIRWGRTAEGPGEDPWLCEQIAIAKVRGFQGADLASEESLAACAKHFVAYGPVEGGREYAPVDISERTLREIHLPAFAAAVKAGVATVMPSFTDLNGIPLTVHVPLLRDWLRREAGFDGVIVSDYHAIAELLNHGVASDLADAAAQSLKAGVDIDMMSDGYRHGLPIALERGQVTIADIDQSVRRVLQLKERLGLFDDPYRRGASVENPAALVSRRQLARSIGARAILMLKNDGDVLPLLGTVRQVALIGPLADAAEEMRGPWWAAGVAENHVSVRRGLADGLQATEVVYAPGVALNGTLDDAARQGIAAAVDLCRSAEAILLCLGEAATMSGEAASRADPELPGAQRALAEAVLDAAAERGIPVTVILFSGRPLIVPWLIGRADAVLAAWFLGCEAGNAIADVVSGRASPSARTPISWPRTVGQVPVYFGQRPTGRPQNPTDHFTSKYLDVPNEPLFPFGYGLTYGRFTYANLRVTPETVGDGDTIEVSIDVSNRGGRAAEETVFLFVHDRVASVTRPVLELKGFGKITLEPGKSGTVALSMPAAALRFLGRDLAPVFEPGEVEVLVGPSADRTQLLKSAITLRR